MSQTLNIPERFRGPPRSGNGGYVAGIFAAELGLPADAPVEVTLRSPIPLDQDLDIFPGSDTGTTEIKHGETLIAQIKPATLELDIPEPPAFEHVLALQPDSVCLQIREDSPIPGARGLHPICFCCGANHPQGLHVFSAPVDEQQVAAAWSTQVHWGDEAGMIPDSFLWTALDCPGQLAFFAQGHRTGLMGRMTAAIHQKVVAGENLVVNAWPIEIQGNRHLAGSAIFNSSGALVANALAVWFSRAA